MEGTSVQEQIFSPEEKPFRPPVILVFAILTFVGSGFMLLGTNVYFGMTEFLPVWIPLSMLVLLILKIVGAARMISMKKSGFYIYTSAELAFYIPSIRLQSYQDQVFQFLYDWAESLGTPQEQLDELMQTFENQSGSDLPGWVLAISATIAWIAVYGSKLHRMR